MFVESKGKLGNQPTALQPGQRNAERVSQPLLSGPTGRGTHGCRQTPPQSRPHVSPICARDSGKLMHASARRLVGSRALLATVEIELMNNFTARRDHRAWD